MILKLTLITLIVVEIVDISGFIDSLKQGLSLLLSKGKIRKTDYRLKPLDCSYCMNFWISIIFLLYTGELTLLNIAIVLLLSHFTVAIKNIIETVYYAMNNIVAKIQRKL